MALDAEWVRSLVDQKEPETATLEYKRQHYATDDRGRKEFASDVVSLANAHGGILLIGIDEDDDGRARAIVPLTGNEDAEMQRVDQWLARQIFPRLQSYELRTISVDGGFVLALRIPQQFAGPFQASHGTWTRFPLRTGRITADMDYWQLASAFGQRSRIVSDMRAWRTARLAQLRSWLGTRMNNQSWGFLHIMPLSAFAEGQRVDWGRVRAEGFVFRDYRGNTKFNADGLIATLVPSQSPLPLTEYVQFFRNGCVEHAWHAGTTQEDAAYVRGIRSACILLDSIPRISEELRRVDLDGSVAMGLALTNIHGKRLEGHEVQNGFVFDDHSEPFVNQSIDLDDVLFPDLATLSDAKGHLPDQFREICRAFGRDGCNYFDANGAISPQFARYGH